MAGWRDPIHLSHIHVWWPNIGTGIAMAVQAPTHAQRMFLRHDRHLVNSPVTGRTTDTGGNVHAVVEIGVFRQHVHLDPLQRLFPSISGTNRFKCRTVCPDLRMAIHTCCSRRNRCKSCVFDSRVTVSAIQADIASVQLVTKRDRLRRRITGIGEFWRKPVPNRKNNRCGDNWQNHTDHQRYFIRPAGKYDRHVLCPSLL